MFRSPVLSIRAFRDLWLGQAISMFGDSLYYVLNAFMIKKLTGSNMLVGLNGALECLPYLLIGPYAGVLADRMDRRKIMFVSDLCSFVTLMLLGAVVLGFANPPVECILANGFLLASSRSFFAPAKNACIPALVPEDLVLQANSVNAATQNAMPMLGLGLSAAVVGALYAASRTWFYFSAVLCNGISFLGSAWFVRKLPTLVPERTGDEKHPVQELKDGLSYVKRSGVLRGLFTMSFVVSLMISPFFVAYVAANEAWLGGSPQTLAMLEFSFFLGMVLSSALIGRLKLANVGLSAVGSLVAVGVCVAAMGYTRSFPIWAVLNFAAGLALPFCDVPVQSYIQLTVPDEFRGRVMSVRSMIGMGVQPLGLSLGGFLLDRAGLTNMFLVMGGGMALGAVISLPNRELRRSRLPQSAACRAAAGEGVDEPQHNLQGVPPDGPRKVS